MKLILKKPEITKIVNWDLYPTFFETYWDTSDPQFVDKYTLIETKGDRATYQFQETVEVKLLLNPSKNG